MAGTEVNNLIRGAHHARFVLHNDHRVAGVAELLKNADQASGIARVQADTRFVEHKERVDQARAEAGGQVDPLGFAAGEGAGGAVERQITQANVVEIAEPRPNFVKNKRKWIIGFRLVFCRESFNELKRVANRQRVEIGQRKSRAGILPARRNRLEAFPTFSETHSIEQGLRLEAPGRGRRGRGCRSGNARAAP